MVAPTLEQRLAVRNRPKRTPVMYQTWRDLLFLHWTIAPAIIQATLPDGLTVDTFEGKAYIGIVPFFMDRIRPKPLPPLPKISYFLETNVRTYVYDHNGIPGVWFYSLDASQSLAVKIARWGWRLPYHHAKMYATQRENGIIDYQSQRHGTSNQSRFVYRGSGNSFFAEPNTLEFFLAERYILFAQTRRGLQMGHVHHTPYPLESAEVTHHTTHLLTLNKLPLPNRPPDHALYSTGVDVDVFALSNY